MKYGLIVVTCIANAVISIGTAYYVKRTMSEAKFYQEPTYKTELERKAFSTYDTLATQQYVIDEIQRASFCQNWVLTMVDEWKESKANPNASLKDKLGPSLWERCSRYLMSPVIPKSKK